MKTTRNRKFYKVLIVMVVLAIQLMSMPQMVSAAASVDFAQLSTLDSKGKVAGGWVNGNLNENNSYYVEGMSTPQRLILQGLNPNLGSQSITMSYQFRLC